MPMIAPFMPFPSTPLCRLLVNSAIQVHCQAASALPIWRLRYVGYAGGRHHFVCSTRPLRRPLMNSVLQKAWRPVRRPS